MINKKIAVVLGGFSLEREVSLNSALAITRELLSLGYTGIQYLDVRDKQFADLLDSTEWEVFASTAPQSFLPQELIDPILDSAYRTSVDWKRFAKEIGAERCVIALHGEFGEDGEVQAILEEMRIPFNGSSAEVSRLCIDKWKCSQAVLGICDVPHRLLLTLGDHAHINREGDDYFLKSRKLPLFAKPRYGGSSVGNVLLNTPSDLKKLLPIEYILEEYIQGRELTVSVLDGVAMPIIEIVSAHDFDYHDKYLSSETQEICPAELESRIAADVSRIAMQCYVRLRCCGLARLDFILDSNNILYFLEANTLPGLTVASLSPKAARAAGIPFERLFT